MVQAVVFHLMLVFYFSKMKLFIGLIILLTCINYIRGKNIFLKHEMMKKLSLLFFCFTIIISILICYGCKKDPVVPTIETITATNITSTSAISGGTIRSNGGADIIESGIMYTIPNTITTWGVLWHKSGDGTKMGSFTSTLTGLSSDPTCSYQAYAENSAGTGYGEMKTFTTFP